MTLDKGPLPTPIYHAETNFQHTVRRWASTLRPTNEDEYGILGVLDTLALTYSRVRKSNNQFTGHGQRCGIDGIIEIAWSARTDRHCNFKYALCLS
jgi:hypothetical protein